VVIVVVTSVLFYGTHRLRVTMEPVVVIGAALFVCQRWTRASGRVRAEVAD
jgi:hypothetical protein